MVSLPTRHQPACDRFLRDQTHRPAGAAFGRVATHHCDDPLSLTVVEYGGGTRALLFKERCLQAVLPIATADIPNRLGGEGEDRGNLRCTNPFCQLQ